MTSIIHFACPDCSRELEVPSAGPDSVPCPDCKTSIRIGKSPGVRSGTQVDVCALCGHPDLYVQKDFNRALGLGIVTVGVLGSLLFFGMREPFLATGALFAMALLDGAIYLLVGEVTVCYSCHAIYRGFGPNPGNETFNLELLERYGGRDPRR